MSTSTKANTIDEYIASFPKNIQIILEELRQTIRDAAPEAVEAISWNMPTFKLNGNLVHFAAHKSHIGFYPAGASAIEAFKEKLTSYKTSKGAVQFPLNKSLPTVLVREMVKFRVKENLAKK